MTFKEKLRELNIREIRAKEVTTLQVNLGYRCNMACTHCHVQAGPQRNEEMDRENVDRVIAILRKSRIEQLDITGGAPELNPHFKRLVSGAVDAGCDVTVRSNLTVFFEDGIREIPAFLAEKKVNIIASLPCYLEQNVDAMRGKGAYEKSICALRLLNNLGYGKTSGDLKLYLVYNPRGPFLAPLQRDLEAMYRKELFERAGVVFTGLLALNNIAVGNFRKELEINEEFDEYHRKLVCAFNPSTLDQLMCRSLVSVRWDGALYDCDFNQALGLPVAESRRHISEFDPDRFSSRPIVFDDHCFGCTAGAGSSCRGALR